MSDERGVASLFGALLMAVGALIMVLCGLCSLTVFAIFTAPAGGGGDIASVLAMIAVFGGVPAGAGLGLFLWGRRLRRR